MREGKEYLHQSRNNIFNSNYSEMLKETDPEAKIVEEDIKIWNIRDQDDRRKVIER